MNEPELTIEGLIHDLNNVFQTIGESADLLHSDPKWAKLAGAIQRSVDHGQRLVRSILEKNRQSEEPSSVIESAIQFAHDYLECIHGPELTFEQRIDTGFVLQGDPAAWERVLVNLFLNSAEAGAHRVEIFANQHGIVIQDDGPGIPSDLLPRIFQPHVSTKSLFSGLGLYVVQSIVEQHGGTVAAANLPNGGAEFRITLTL
jgi:signal transduction histidine kinase